MTDTDNPRIVRVPIAGYIEVEIDPTIEVRTSTGWDSATEFEEAACEAADEAMSQFFTAAREAKVRDVAIDWYVQSHHAIVRGNLCYAEQNSVDDMGTD